MTIGMYVMMMPSARGRSAKKNDSMPNDRNHDTLVYRLAQILIKLNQGEKLDPQLLADEFGVNLRTIQRDLNERFGYLPLVKSERFYQLDPAFLGKLSSKDIFRFASLAGVRGLFPSLDDDFLRDIFDRKLADTLLVKGHHYEDLSEKNPGFLRLQEAIAERCCVRFAYTRQGQLKRYVVEPYKLVNHKGIWYLAACHEGKLKSFSFGKLDELVVTDEHFIADASHQDTIACEDGIWLSKDKQEVVLKVAAEIAPYFRRRALVPHQEITKALDGGGLLITAKVAHPDQILPIVRYWIPYVRIISPEGWQKQVEDDLRGYLGSRT